MRRERTILILLSLYFVIAFFWRFFLPDRETPSLGLKLLTIGIDLMGIAGIFALSIYILKEKARPIDAMGAWMVLPAVGFIAGLGVLFMHLSGQPVKRLAARSSPSPAQVLPATTQTPSAELVQTEETLKIGQRMKALLTELTEGEKNIVQPHGPGQQLTREDLHDARERAHAVNVGIDELMSLSREAIAKSLPLPNIAGSSDEQTWRLAYRTNAALEKYFQVLEENYADYHANGIEPKRQPAKPWQIEAMRLRKEIEALQRQAKLLSGRM